MSARNRLGRNSPCPCGSGAKYKYCCLGKKDWEFILSQGLSYEVRHLKARGKNIVFLHELATALQLDGYGPKTRGEFKRAFTPAAVKRIYEAVAKLWPDGTDLERTLLEEKGNTSGLYVGTYDPDAIFGGVTRHSIYSDSILLVDPFLHPARIRPEFNPLLHPEEHRVSAAIAANIWLAMAPWIQAGLVKFVRVPGDFDSKLFHETIKIQEARLKGHPEIERLLEAQAEQDANMSKDFRWYYILNHSDEKLVEDYKKFRSDANPEEIRFFLHMIKQTRDSHPYYMEPIQTSDGERGSEFISQTSGANYEMAKRTALLSGSHLITDIPSRWKEMEVDRAEASLTTNDWSPFAKAFQALEFKFLQNVPLEAALRLRKEDRLQNMRSFMTKVWKSCGTEEPFSQGKADSLSAELQERIREAEAEWRKIDAELIRWLGGLGTVAAPFIAAGGATWIPAAVSAIVGGVAAVTHSQHQRATFGKRYPAGFFLELKKRSRGHSRRTQ